MKFNISVRTINFIIVLVILANTFEDTNQQEVFNCKKLFMRMAKRQFHNMGICARKLKSPRNSLLQYHFRMDCVLKCVMEMDNLLDQKSKKVTEQTMQNFFDRYLPEDIHEAAHIMMGGCLYDWAPLMDGYDVRCKAYGGFIGCLQGLVGDFCPM